MFPRIVAGAALPYRGHESISKDRHASSATASASTSASTSGSTQSPRSQSKTNQSSHRPWWRMLPYMQQQLQEDSDKDHFDSDDDDDSDGDSNDVSSEGGSLFAYELPKLIPALTTPTTAALREQWSSSPSSSSSSLSPSSLVAASLTAESLPPVVVPPPVLSWPRVSLFRGFKVRLYQSTSRHVT